MGTSGKPKPVALGVAAKAGWDTDKHARNPNKSSLAPKTTLIHIRERDGLQREKWQMEITGVRHDVNRGAAYELVRYTRLNKFPGSLFLEDNNNPKLYDTIYFSRTLTQKNSNKHSSFHCPIIWSSNKCEFTLSKFNIHM